MYPLLRGFMYLLEYAIFTVLPQRHFDSYEHCRQHTFIAKKFNQTECTYMQINMSAQQTECTYMQINMSAQQVLSQLNQRLFTLP